MEKKLYQISSGEPKNLLILMPGAGNKHTSFEDYGFIQKAADAEFEADILTVNTSYEHFSDLTIDKRLHNDVVLPARARGYENIWMGGISLGGFGSMIYARKNANMLKGLVLFAPYLGNKGTLVEIKTAGGLDLWNPEITEDHDERHVWKMIKSNTQPPLSDLPLLLLYGTEDRFAEFHRLLGTRLNPDAIKTVPGGHDWPVWQALWQHFTLEGPLSALSKRSKGFSF
jgi:hypothetical protein